MPELFGSGHSPYPSANPGILTEGAMVWFNAPDLAYSRSSKQQHYNGQIGQLCRFFNDSYCYVLFGRELLLVNTSYLTLHDPPPKLAGRGPSRNYPRPSVPTKVKKKK